MRLGRLAFIVISVIFACLPCSAQELSWTFQRTGFRSTYSSPFQSAISMRGGGVWPVVYGLDANRLQVASLFSVPNPNTSIGTNWHSIGSNIALTAGTSFTSGLALQAASSAQGGFGVAAQWPSGFFAPDVAIVGNSSGLGPIMSGVSAIDFDSEGNLLTANQTTIPGLQQSEERLYDIAVSGLGDVGAVTQLGTTSVPVKFWQKSPLLGSWISTNLNPQGSFLYGPSLDLLYDSAGRPHVLGIDRPASLNSVVAYTFNIISATWNSAILDIASGPRIEDVTAATDGSGTLGAAWVSNGVLKYASLDTTQIAPAWDVSIVTSITPLGTNVQLGQSVGLVFDRNGLPVISFVDNSNSQIWIAYDPPVNVPEPGAITLVGAALISSIAARSRSRLGNGS